MNEIKTATGKIFPCHFFVYSEDSKEAQIRIANTPIETVAKVFSDPAETVQLWHGNQYLAKYTSLKLIIPEGSVIRVVLRKE